METSTVTEKEEGHRSKMAKATTDESVPVTSNNEQSSQLQGEVSNVEENVSAPMKDTSKHKDDSPSKEITKDAEERKGKGWCGSFFFVLKTTFYLLMILHQVKSFWPSQPKEIKKTPSVSPLYAELYSDLYGDQRQIKEKKGKRGFSLLNFLLGETEHPKDPTMPVNTGIPSKQYIQMTNINRKFQSYRYSVLEATASKAQAASEYRQTSFQRALGKAVSGLSPTDIRKLQNMEQSFLVTASSLSDKIHRLQASLVASVFNSARTAPKTKAPDANNETVQSMNKFLEAIVTDVEEQQCVASRIDINEIAFDKENATTLEAMTSNETMVMSTNAPLHQGECPSDFTFNTTQATSSRNNENTMQVLNATQSKVAANIMNKTETIEALGKAQRELEVLELGFIKSVADMLDPARAATLRTILEGDTAVRGSGRLLDKRPLTTLLGVERKQPKLFVTRFPGDIQASQVSHLREEVTAIVRSAEKGDEVLVIVQSAGGTVTGYGLAAAQLLRFKEAGLKLTVAVEQVAASGGYMATCVGDKIVCSPFAVVGGIGVVKDVPNLYDRLVREGVQFHSVTAGKYKRTLSPTKKVSGEDLTKAQEEVDEVWTLFKDFVAEQRPQLDMDSVATGESWFGTAALERNLCDEMKTVDAVMTDFVDAGYGVYQVEYTDPNPSFFDKLLALDTSESAKLNSGEGLLGQAVRWLVRTIASEIHAEFGDTVGLKNKQEQDQYYMAV